MQMTENIKTEKVSTNSEKDYQRDYSKWKENKRFCKKCLSPIVGDKEFCDFECRKEYFSELRKLDEEVLGSLISISSIYATEGLT